MAKSVRNSQIQHGGMACPLPVKTYLCMRMWMEKAITQMHPRSMRKLMPHSYLGSSAKGHPHRGVCGEAGQNGWEN
eukprot:3238001-Rhodomonas_salina.1